MRYLITLTNGTQWATDFEPGDPIRTPDGVEILQTIIASEVGDPTRDMQVAFNDAAFLTILDTDCG